MAKLTVVADKPAMSEAAAERMTVVIQGAVQRRGVATVSLTGGDTPDLLYQLLADAARPWRRRIAWDRVQLFWGDERNVPADHQDSNYGLANRLLLQHVDVPAAQVHRIRGELPASEAGELYDAMLRARRAATVGPLFDVMLLGIGSNAHIASIFPESPLLTDTGAAQRLAAGVSVHQLDQWRITMTPRALLDSACIVMIASGQGKADAIAAAIEQPLNVERYPAQLLRQANDRVEWIMDSAAAARLRAAPPA